MSEINYLQVAADNSGQRIDNFLKSRLAGVSRDYLCKIIRTGQVRVNKGRIRVNYKLAAGDLIRLPPVVQLAKKKVGLGVASERLEVLFENKGLLVVNKPAGLAVHGGSGVNFGLIESLRKLRADAAYLELVHRLDRDTSGCIIIAKRRSVLRTLHQDFREDRIKKTYHALVLGKPPNKFICNVMLARDNRRGDERIVKAMTQASEKTKTQAARTKFALLKNYYLQHANQQYNMALLEARPITGRTHQIRVHSKYMGYPLAGDPKYGDEGFNRHCKQLGLRRLFLHAVRLAFSCPITGDKIVVKAPYDDKLNNFIQAVDGSDE